MIMAKNPWLPFVEPPRLSPLPDRGRVLVIIPTAGKNLPRLKNCLDSVRRAAGDLDHRVVVVICPVTVKRTKEIKALCRGQAEVQPLDGSFNYCRSINAGLAQRRPEDGYALFLNDDVEFTGHDSLASLKRTLQEERWACVGPYLPGWHPGHSSVRRQRGAVRTNEPVNGCCALWDFKWLERIGHLDEEFGRGWGLDEADLCLRAVRSGACYGRQDAVSIRHQHHGTFGDEFAAYEGPAHQRNLRYFRQKHGAEVGGWGQTDHWSPLPGVQVSLAAHNAGRWIGRCLESVERALDGFRWSLFIGDDCSTDDTWQIIEHHCQTRSGADFCRIKQYPRKAATVDRAKNRVLSLGASFQRQYPAMCLMDADDEMGLHRVRHLLWRARDNAHLAVMGDHECIEQDRPRRIVTTTAESQINGGFGPWATIFHSSLVPENSRLFCEDKHRLSHGDVHLWIRWFLRGIRIVPFPGAVVHHYHMYPGTVSRPQDREFARRMRKMWDAKRSRLLSLASPIEVRMYSEPAVRVRAGGAEKRGKPVGSRGTTRIAGRELVLPGKVLMYSQPAVQARATRSVNGVKMIQGRGNGQAGASLLVSTGQVRMYSQPAVKARAIRTLQPVKLIAARDVTWPGSQLRVLASPRMYSTVAMT